MNLCLPPAFTAMAADLVLLAGFLYGAAAALTPDEVPVLTLPRHGFGHHACDGERWALPIRLVRSSAGVIEFVVKRETVDDQDLKDRLYPVARTIVNARSKLSEIPVLVIAPGDIQYAELARLFGVPRDPMIGIYRVVLSTPERERDR